MLDNTVRHLPTYFCRNECWTLLIHHGSSDVSPPHPCGQPLKVKWFFRLEGFKSREKKRLFDKCMLRIMSPDAPKWEPRSSSIRYRQQVHRLSSNKRVISSSWWKVTILRADQFSSTPSWSCSLRTWLDPSPFERSRYIDTPQAKKRDLYDLRSDVSIS